MPATDHLLIEPLGHEHAAGMVAALGHESVGTYIGAPAVTPVDAMHERAAIHHDNAASIRLIERVGFTQVTTATRPLASYDEGDVVFVRIDAPLNEISLSA